MNKLKKLIAVAIIACMALSFTACSDTTWAYKTGNKQINSGLYIMQTIQANFMAQSHQDIKPEITNLYKQTLEGKPAKQWIIDTAKTIVDEYLAIELKFDELGLSLTESDNNKIDQTVKENWPLVSAEFERNGVGKESYRASVENSKKRDLIFDKYYEKGGIEEISDADLMVHFEENYASVNMFGIKITLGDDITEEQQAKNDEAQANAEKLFAMLEKGDKTYNEVYSEFKKIENEGKEEADKVDTTPLKDEDTKNVIDKDSKSPSADIVKAIFDQVDVDGKPALLHDDNGYYIVKRYDVKKDTKNFDTMRKPIIVKVKGEDFDKLVEKWAKDLNPNVVANDAAIKKYNPKNIDIKL